MMRVDPLSDRYAIQLGEKLHCVNPRVHAKVRILWIDPMVAQGVNMQKRPFSVSYIFFYVLFSDDTWRLAAGFIFAVFLGPLVTQGRDLSQGGQVMIWLMILAIGWSVTAWPAKKITDALKRTVKRASK
jgi:hypothetical protein